MLKTIGQSALEEGLEEVLQYPFEGLGKKATYAPETPVFSTKEQAVINPIQQAQAGLVGGIAGGLLGGGSRVLSNAFNNVTIPNQVTNDDVRTQPVESNGIQTKTEINNIPQLTEDYIMKNWVADNAKTYRYAKPDDPMSDWGHAMFADDPTKYGNPELGILDDSLYSVKKSDLTNISDLRDVIINQWNEDVEDGTAYNYTFTDDELSLSGEDIVEGFDPKDIVDTAEAFDHPEFTQWLWDRVLEPRGIVGVKTKDGGIVFDPSIIQKESNLLIQATQPIDDIQQEAAPTVKTKQTIEKELVQKHKQAEQLRREYEQLRAASKLTPDELTIADNIRKGKLNPENIPQGMNAQVINDVANAGRLYDQVNNEIKDYNIQRKQTLYETMDSLLEDADNAKDKAGVFLSREIQERNSIDVFGEKAGKRINETVFRPVHDNEARRTKFINEYVRKAKELNITNKKHKLDAPMLINGKQQHTLTEREAVQLVGEKKITLDDLPQTMDKTKIQNAVTEMRKWFDNFIRWANEVLVRNGYKPVDYRKDYFPHFDDRKTHLLKQ